MIALLSPAKRLDFDTPHSVTDASVPALIEESGKLMKTTRNLSQRAIRELMGISPELAKLHSDRFQVLTTAVDQAHARPAILSFSGDTYLGLGAKTMSADDLDFAQDHVMILSGLYGLLRAKDLMQPYRLEMGSKLQTRRGKNLYAFWDDRIRKALEHRLGEDGVIVNLASNEYFRSVQPRKLAARVITPVFKETRDGKTRTLFMFAKQARGLMARYIVDNRITDPEDLKGFDSRGYRYREDLSEGDTWVFERPQPPPKR